MVLYIVNYSKISIKIIKADLTSRKTYFQKLKIF